MTKGPNSRPRKVQTRTLKRAGGGRRRLSTRPAGAAKAAGGDGGKGRASR